MHCKYCKKDSPIKTRIASLKLATLECKHTVPLSETDYKQIEFDTLFEQFKSSDGKTPFKFQKEGIYFGTEAIYCPEPGIHLHRVLIADEMGLGKTPQSLGLLSILTRANKSVLPALIVVKSATRMQWFKEVLRWCGLKYLPQVIPDGKTPPVNGFNTYICSYDVLRRFTTKEKKDVERKYGLSTIISQQEVRTNPFYDFPFKTIILDEVQSIKNITSERAKEIMEICKGDKHIFGLSGTPIKNNAGEYANILTILRPDIFPSQSYFLKYFVEQYDTMCGVKAGGLKNPERFRDLTKSFIIRRTRAEVLPDLPKTQRVLYHVDFENEKIKKLYEAEEASFIRDMEENIRKKGAPMNILARIAKLRHIIGLIKTPAVIDQAANFLLETDRKLLIFNHHQDVRQATYQSLRLLCLEGAFEEPLLFDSDMNDNQRMDVIQKFVDIPSRRIMILSTLAAGEGVDKLQLVCSDMYIHERQWNPANEEQVEGRLERIGQTAGSIQSTYFVASGTIDEYFSQLVEEKRSIMQATLDGKDIPWNEQGLMKDLLEILETKSRKKLVRGF